MPRRQQYKVKDFHLVWKIENFYSVLEENSVICSPSFRISSEYCISFYLALKDGKIQLSIEKDNSLQLQLNDCESELSYGSSTTTRLPMLKLPELPGWMSESSIQRHQMTNGQLVMNCHIFLGEFLFREKQASEKENLDLLKLSRDIRNLYTTQEFSDVTLHTEGKQFKVHKSIILARSPQMVEALGLNVDSSPTKHVSLYPSSVLKLLLEYIYAAKLDPVHMEMSMGFFSAVDVLKFDKLKEKLCSFPKEVTLDSHPTTARTTFTWPISGISTIDAKFPKKVMFSPLLCSSFSDQRQFEICLEMSNLDNSQNISISSRLYVGHSSAKYSIKSTTCIVDVFGESHYSQDSKIHVEKSDWYSNISKWNLIYSIDKNILNREKDILQPNDRLTLMFDFTIYKVEHEIKKSVYELAPLEDVTFDNDDYQKLSSDLMNLYKSEELSDITLKVGNHQFKAHKVIISARAPKILSNELTSEIKVSGISSDALNAMLSYIYSATVPNLTCRMAMKLYLAADKYELPLLKQKCLEFVKTNISF